MNKNLLEKIEAFLKEATPESILANCEKYGCVVEDEDYFSLISSNDKSFKSDIISEFLCKSKDDMSFKSEDRKKPNYALAA